MSFEREPLRELTGEIVAAYIGNNHTTREDLILLIALVGRALGSVGAGTPAAEPNTPELAPAVAIRKSVTPDHIVCLEDGKRFKSLKRHLATSHDATPDDYRRKWSLPPDYPMVAANYSARRSELARMSGLGDIIIGRKSGTAKQEMSDGLQDLHSERHELRASVVPPSSG